MLAGCGALALGATGCGGGAHGTDSARAARGVYLAAVAKAADVTGEVSGYRFALTSSTRFGGESFSLHGTGAMSEGGTQGSMSMELEGKTLSEVIDKPYVYVELPGGAGSSAPGARSWLRADIDTFGQSFGGSSLGSSATDPTQTLSFLKAAGSVSKLGAQDVRGTPATHYHAIVELDRYAAAVPSSERGSAARYAATVKRITGGETLPLDVWIDEASRVRRIALSLHLCGPNGAIDESIDMTLYGYGRQPAVQPPPSSQVTDIGERIGAEVAHNLQQLHC